MFRWITHLFGSQGHGTTHIQEQNRRLLRESRSPCPHCGQDYPPTARSIVYSVKGEFLVLPDLISRRRDEFICDAVDALVAEIQAEVKHLRESAEISRNLTQL